MSVATTASSATGSPISCDEALAIARKDAETVYRDLSGFRIIIEQRRWMAHRLRTERCLPQGGWTTLCHRRDDRNNRVQEIRTVEGTARNEGFSPTGTHMAIRHLDAENYGRKNISTVRPHSRLPISISWFFDRRNEAAL